MIEKNEKGNDAALETLKKIIEKADIAMLVSIGLDGKIVSRPMQLQKVEFDGDIWFLTRTDTDKYEDIHSLVEANLIDRIGDAGKKLHTGCNHRNDRKSLY